jgi:predicted DNA-binding transcriptional regulator YafY
VQDRELPYDHPSNPEVTIELTRRGVMMVESELHLGSVVMRNADGSGRLCFHCPPSEIRWFARYFIPVGEEAHVLGPPELLAEMRRAAKRILEKYGNGE